MMGTVSVNNVSVCKRERESEKECESEVPGILFRDRPFERLRHPGRGWTLCQQVDLFCLEREIAEISA